MSENNVLESSASDGTSDNDFFIDDYSQLRLSYYQYREDEPSLLESFEKNGDLTMLNNTQDSEPKSNESSSQESRRKLREYFISQIPDFPHPSQTVASIIASASQRMNSSNSRFIYDNKTEQGAKREQSDHAREIFSPARRSTLKPKSSKRIVN